MIDPVQHIDETPNQDSQLAQSTRVALAHDWLVARRGGELVLDAIIKTLSQSDSQISTLYIMFDAEIPITPSIDKLPKSISSLNKLPSKLRRWLLFRYPQAVEQLAKHLASDHQSHPIDLLISTHSAAIKAIKAPSQIIPHICYCHTPARYLWSQTDAYSTPGLVGRLRATGLKFFAPSLKSWDKSAADSVTHFVANSTHTATQIKQHYLRDSIVIHPPVRTNFFTLSDQPRNDALLLVSALEPYKRVDLAIDSAAIANRPLIIVGSGSHESALRKHAIKSKADVQFLGHQSDEQLKEHYQSAHAFLFPQIEDFGITAVEAQSCGCPVIARSIGGALDTVIADSTGAFFQDPTPDSIAEAIEQIPSSNATAHHCRNNAMRFSESVFQSKFEELINRVLQDQQCAEP